MASSAANQGVIWVHNDSGDEARFYAVGAAGQTLMTVRLEGARAVDWEDMALVGGSLYAADIGDNAERRADIQIYRTAEQVELEGEGSADSERMDLRYPDGSHDAEALLVHPTTGEIGIVTKSDDGPGALYVTPAFSPGRKTLTPAGSVPVTLATAAAVDPDGKSIVVRDYTDAYVFDLDGESLASAFDEPPARIEMPFAVQAEAITFSADGRSLLTTHEGRGAAVHRVDLPAAAAGGGASTTTPAPAPEPVSPEPSPLGAIAVIAGIALLAWFVTASSRQRRASGPRGDGPPGGS